MLQAAQRCRHVARKSDVCRRRFVRLVSVMHHTSGTDAEPPNNAELVGRALLGGTEGRRAWDQLVRANARAVWKVLWTLRLSPGDREDAFQSTWIKAIERLHTVREPALFHVWVMTIARHEALALLARSNRLVPTGDIEDEILDYPVDTQHLEALERVDIARAALARLGEDCRDLIRLLTIDGMTYKQIEEAMGWAPGGTAIRRDRCLDKLRKTPEIARYLRALVDGEAAAGGGTRRDRREP